MKIVVSSREIVKPSNPTPGSLHQYPLSFLDQMNGQIFGPMLYFYPSKSGASSTIVDRTEKLKKSLSEILTKFYPLAGRLGDSLRYTNCADEGVELTKANVNCRLSQILADQTNMAKFNELLPHHSDDYAGNVPMIVQLNFFECGGMVIAIRINHKLMDALSITRFVNCWATIARGDGDDNMVCPRLDLARFFPPRDVPERIFDNQESTIIGKRVVFSKDDISILRDRYATRHLRPTLVETVTTFILSRFVAATYQMTNMRRNYQVSQLVNISSRLNPPVLEPYIGNLYVHATVTMALEKGTLEEVRAFLTTMRKATKTADVDFVKNHQNELYLTKRERQDEQSNSENLVEFSFSSLASFPIYEADFGWGKPIWFTSGKDPLDTTVTFHPTRSGEGIEAVIKLKENDMAKLLSDEEFLSFTSENSGAKMKFPCSL